MFRSIIVDKNRCLGENFSNFIQMPPQRMSVLRSEFPNKKKETQNFASLLLSGKRKLRTLYSILIINILQFHFSLLEWWVEWFSPPAIRPVETTSYRRQRYTFSHIPSAFTTLSTGLTHQLFYSCNPRRLSHVFSP